MHGVTGSDVIWVSHFVAAGLMIALAVYVGRNHSEKPLGRLFVCMVLAVAVWVIGSMARLFTLDPAAYVVLTAVKYLGVTTAPIWFLLFVLRYSGRDRWVTRRLVTLLFVGPVLTVLVVLTTQSHGLFYAEFAVVTVEETAVLERGRGPGFWLFAAFGWGLLALGTVLLLLTAIGQPAIYQKQSFVIALGVVIPWVVGIAYVFRGWPHPAVDPTPIGFAITAVLFGVGIFTTRLIDVVPVARSRLLDALDDGVVVVDADGRLLDANATARELLSDETVGTDIEVALPSEFDIDGGEHVVETDAGRRVFRPRTIELTDGLGRNTGRVIYLDDVTQLIERERRSVLQRVFRHNIRNDLNVTVGYLDLLEERVQPADREYVDRARASATRVVELSEKARQFERAIDSQDGRTTASATAVVERVVEDARGEYPQAQFTVDLDGGVGPVTVIDEESFRTAIANLIENAVLHNDAAQPSVAVHVVAEDDTVRIEVADDGPGIPEQELTALEANAETPLEHGSGFGLWLVKWTVSLSSGELSFAENEPRGSVVTVRLPAADASSR
ncbi:histidine kinase N-terminal 7TM domain-containing protein [Natronococcus roseus]|uniref:histidine kinase N-terminal 7TM domain-containing protein n=1 Tax=Natronococcus roseus TaxID=1052014 RepID=UPI00374DAEC3